MTIQEYCKLFSKYGFDKWELFVDPKNESKLIIRTYSFSKDLIDEVDKVVSEGFSIGRWERLKA